MQRSSLEFTPLPLPEPLQRATMPKQAFQRRQAREAARQDVEVTTEARVGIDALTPSLVALAPKEQESYASSSIPIILRQCVASGVKDANQVAYILATAQHESRFGLPRYPRSESFVEDHNPRKQETNLKTGVVTLFRNNHVTGRRSEGDSLESYFDEAYGGRLGNEKGTADGANFRGRGMVQITGRENYKRLGEKLQLEHYSYTFDNKTYGTKENPIDLELNPTHVNLVPELAAKIMVSGMLDDGFAQRGKGLNHYFNEKNTDFTGARRIVNGSDRADDIAKLAMEYAAVLNKDKAWARVLDPTVSATPTVQPLEPASQQVIPS
jgi:putative chitinase